jgi:hypothetical protein
VKLKLRRKIFCIIDDTRKVYSSILHEPRSFAKTKGRERAQKLVNRSGIGERIRKRQAGRSFGDNVQTPPSWGPTVSDRRIG